jgi:hypothetical protein
MRREIIEFVRQFKQSLMDLEMAVLFLSDKDYVRMREYLREFKKVLSEYLEKASELESKIEEKAKY